MSEFQKRYDALNARQKEAVNIIDGPVLVIAGPGTGKTELLSLRVANILQKTDTDPSNILCLTFTNKAALNMRDRLLSLIGTTAHNVTVKTFHGFAVEIMASNPEYFWNGARLSTVPDTLQLEVIQDILAALPLDNPLALKFAGAYTMTGDVKQGLMLAKEAGLSPDKLRAIIELNLAYIDLIEPQLVDILSRPLSAKNIPQLIEQVSKLPNQKIDERIMPLLSLYSVINESLKGAVALDEGTNKTVFAGKWKKRFVQTIGQQKGMHDERRRNAWWRALADVYEQYRTELHKRGYYDYADMIVEVITQLEQHDDLRAIVQEKYLYTLIDEFQDTNAAQLRLAHLVANSPANEGRPNLMAVGDDDQSIFKFNGAELNNILRFKSNYPETNLIVLTDTYRSTQAVLETAKTVIEQAADRIVNREPDITKDLVAKNPPEDKGRIEHLVFPTQGHQMAAVAQEIAAYRKEKHNNESIAVLARSHKSLRSMADILLKEKVPVSYEQQSNVLDHEAVNQVFLIAQTAVAVAAGHNDIVSQNIPRLLSHPMWQVSAATLWKLAVDNYQKTNWLESLLEHSDKQLAATGHWLVWLGSEANYQPLAVMLEYILGLRESLHLVSPFKDFFLDKKELNSDYLSGLSAIQQLRGLAQEFSAHTSARLEDFVRFISLNKNNEAIITDESWFVSDENAVQLLTVHKAKGLEFDTVYIIDAIEGNWQPRQGGRKPPANLPLQPYGDDYNDYVRLMYVAATRSKHTLVFASFTQDDKGSQLLPTPLVRGVNSREVKGNAPKDSIAILEQQLSFPRLSATNEKALLSPRLENYSLSATHLINFLNVAGGGPAYFLERNLLCLPEAKTAQLAYGNAMHAALDLAQKLTNNKSFKLGQVLQSYEEALVREAIPREEFDRYLPHGQQILKQFFDNDELRLQMGALSEHSLNDICIGDARIKGKLDRIDPQNPERLTIVDYKTGAPLSSLTTRDKTKAIKAWRHRTQLIFYSLLAKNAQRFAKFPQIEAKIIYLEAESGTKPTVGYQASDEELKHIELLVQAVWQHIKQLNLPDISAYTPDYEGIVAFEQDLIYGKV